MRSTVAFLLAVLAMPGPATAQDVPTLTERYELERRAGRFDLPNRLDEVSGLAFTPDGRLFVHGDERAHIYEVSLAEEDVTKRFSLGDPAEHGDFEGLEVVGDRFFLLTSTGLLYESREGDEDRTHVPFRRVDTGLGSQCEAEGLAYDPRANDLLVACKASSRSRGTVVIHRLPVTPDRVRPAPIRVALAALEVHGLEAELHPSGIAVDPVTGHLILVAAREELIVEIDGQGRVLSAFQLSRRRHPQPEGIGFGPGGTLYLADEAAGRDRGRITYYHPRAPAQPSRQAPRP